MKIYNVVGYAVLLLYTLACAFMAPESYGPSKGILVGAAYMFVGWFLAGLYLSDVIHLGIAHRSLDYQEWFVKAVTLLNNFFGLYVDPIAWVNRHRHHHKYSDHPGDPNKLSADGFWKTVRLCIFPYPCQSNVATDRILTTWPFRLVSNWFFTYVSFVTSYALVWYLTGDWKYALTLWLGLRVFAMWVNLVQNYWTHDRRFGYRRYDDAGDNAMNIGEWFPVTATFSACYQNNHHHSPTVLRLSHDESEYDFGFQTVRVMKWMGLVQATPKGRTIPEGAPLTKLGF